MSQHTKNIPKNVTIEDIYALFREHTARFEAEQETERIKLEAARAEREAEQAARMAEHDRMFKRLDRELGRLGNTFGEWAEDFFDKKIVTNFRALGFMFTKNSRRVSFQRENEPFKFAEVDYWLENGNVVMAVEVKSNFKSRYMERTIERLNEVGAFMRERGDNRQLLGGIAGMTFEDGIEKYALKQGLFVITQSGENAEIISPKQVKVYS